MKKVYAILLLVGATVSTYAQDTLKHYDIFDLVESPLEDKVFPEPWGYKYGHGGKGHHEFAEKYYVSEEMKVVGIVVYLDDVYGSATSNQEDWVAIYSKDGNKPAPANTPDAQQTIVANKLTFGLGAPNVVLFSNKVLVSDTFFAAFGFPKYDFGFNDPRPQDSIGILITPDRTYDNDPDVFFRNAIRYNGGFWAAPEGVVKGDKKRNFLISPIVTKDSIIDNVEQVLLNNQAITVKSVYPNPVGSTATFSVELQQESNMSVTIMDMSGKTVKTLNYGNVSTGEHYVQMNMSDLESGQYVYVVRSDFGVIASVLNKM